jgi:hypothetical protein
MILNNAPANEAIVSNVGEIGEFRIRNSAKAFNILSSGLYANKIRAIVRELSCNAVDSHAAAGKKDTPFDVHLPNQLEPFFSIRDYGTGLSHEQVTNIYTTYFESTKTASNEFIGALGLGSKSPFSYTDNFTVTAIKDGKKGIYTAFINEAGVPSIALMMTEDTTDPAGVEVKFAVNDRYDFDKFKQEARHVYKHFALRPVVSGADNFQFTNTEYESRDIIPGVHAIKSQHQSIAIMGNIAYPIDIPRSDKTLGDLAVMLNCGLEMHFGIGELDFQASREGLSYIPQTIEAIKNKLEAVSKALSVVLAREANALPNLWDRALYVYKKRDVQLWRTAVQEYVKANPLPTFDDKHGYGARPKTFELKVSDLAKDYNILIKCSEQSASSKTLKNGKTYTAYADGNARDDKGHYITWPEWHINVDAGSVFVINDIKTGAQGRANYHFREEGTKHYSRRIWILEKADKSKEMDLKSFFAAICEPPNDRRIAASTLNKPEREKLGRDVTILKLERRGGSGYRRSDEDMVWRDAGDTSKFPDKDVITGQPITYYYVPLSGFYMQSTKGYTGGKELYEDVKSLKGLFNGEIYGVRKKDIEDIKKKPNWKNFEEHIAEQLVKRDMTKMLMSLVRSNLDHADILQFNNRDVSMFIENKASPYLKFVSVFNGIDKFDGSRYNIERLFRNFAPNKTLDPTSLQTKYNNELREVNMRYPLLLKLSTYRVDASEIAEYVNLIDAKKGV